MNTTAMTPAQRAAIKIEPVAVELDVVLDEEYAKQLTFLTVQARTAPTLHYLLKQIVQALPQNKDWLDPAIERLAKDALDHLDKLNPRIAALNVPE